MYCQTSSTCQTYFGSLTSCLNGMCCSSYSVQPTQPTTQCFNGGQFLGMYCQNSANCQQFYGATSSCQNGVCCSGGSNNSSGALGYCFNGQRSQVRCTANSGCGSSETCSNGLCCTKTGQEWQCKWRKVSNLHN